MEVNYTLPLWTIIISVFIIILPIIWSLIKMYFTQNSLKEDIRGLKTDGHYQDKNIDTLKLTTENKLSEMNAILIATKTLVELLVQDKIKK